jgi:large-conductance mechanosensitive channel
MSSLELREALALFVALVESKLIAIFEAAGEFISAYYSFIIIGLFILVTLVILDLGMKRQEKKEKKKIDAQIKEQMKGKNDV